MNVLKILPLLAFSALLISCIITFIMYRFQFGSRIDIKMTENEETSLNKKKVEFSSDHVCLTGYFYWKKEEELCKDKIIMIVHGHGLTHRDYMLEICEFVHRGYSVFTYDMTGCGESEGINLKGFAQFIIDAQYAIFFLKSQSIHRITIFGHSTGAYAAAALLNIQGDDLNKAIILSAFDVPSKFIRMYMQKHMKIFAHLLQFWLGIFEKIQFGKYASLSGREGICNYQKPVLIVQGDNDDQVELKNSIYNMKEKITNSNAEYLLVKNAGHHPLRYNSTQKPVINQEIFDHIDRFIGGKDENIY